ncbi:MAG: hypothetical protein M0R51_15100 [Clostridia bacterium]|jgi:hypothetical protein|nr:hypothetical protein [Clostridia bacterium]
MKTYKQKRLSAFMQDDFCALLCFLNESTSNGELSNNLANKTFRNNWTIEKMISYYKAHGKEVNSGFEL